MKVVILKSSAEHEKDSHRNEVEYMLTVLLLLTGDLQEARMMQAYLHENYPQGDCEKIFMYCGKDPAVLAFLEGEGGGTLFDGRNAGIAASCNAALRHARGEDVLFLTAPYFLMPPAIRAMQRAAAAFDGAALIFPMLRESVGVGKEQELPAEPCADYQDAAGLCRFAESLSAEQRTSFVFASLDFCFFAKRQVLLEQGCFSEEFQSIPFLMLDLCLRFWKEGRFCVAAHGAFAHRNGITAAYGMRDTELFFRKYGVRYPYSFIPRMDLLQMMDVQKPELSVLEVGCACGATLLAVRNRNPNAELCGIEFDEQAAAFARRFAVVEALDVETLHKPLWHEKFDCIILGDVIEHLRDPWRAMKNLAALLKPNGHVVVSIPNVMHVSVFRMMFAGRWTYEEEGILDRTHLRFFTLAESLALLRGVGLEPQQIARADLFDGERDQALLERLTDFLMPDVDPVELRTYQWLISAQKQG